jgi:hypothetical protein
MSSKTLKVYRFTGDDGKTDYFNEEGINIRKTLLRTPIYGARISSGFGRREHRFTDIRITTRRLILPLRKTLPSSRQARES